MTTHHRRARVRLPFGSILPPLWTLIGLLFLTGCFVSFDGDDDGLFGQNDVTARETFSIDIPVTDQTRLRLEGVNGNVEITGQVGATEVVVSGEKLVGSNSTSDAERRLRDLEVRATDEGDEVVVRTLQPRNTQGRNYVVNYTITVPADFEAQVELVNGNIRVERLDNHVDVSNTNGNVIVRDIAGNAAVTLTNGNIDAEVYPLLDGVIDLSTTNGNIDLAIPAATSADFSARVTNGAIAVDDLDLKSSTSTNRSLTGTLGDGDGTIELRTVNGAITVTGF